MSIATAVNYWPDNKCAKAFWNQQDLPPYRELLNHTRQWLEPRPGDSWLDLGCGGGQLSKALWLKSQGSVAEIIGMDVAPLNDKAYAQHRAELEPRPSEKQFRFIAADMQKGLASWPSERFNGVVSGLAIQYADSFSPDTQKWTTWGYDSTLAQIHRVLKPGGSFVFSVNVPEPSWGTVGVKSLGSIWRSHHPLRYLRSFYRMWLYGHWLKKEARRGRFHFLPADVILRKLNATGFNVLGQRLSYAKQAYVFRCQKISKPASVRNG